MMGLSASAPLSSPSCFFPHSVATPTTDPPPQIRMWFSLFSTTARRLAIFLGGLLVLALAAGCQSDAPPSSYVARVGSQYLTQDNLDRMLAGMGATPDTSTARQQVIEQWVTRTLLYREAQRLNLQSVEEVQRRLEQQRRSILIAAMKNRLYEEADLSPSEEEVHTYFQRHKDQLSLREPYVSVRYLSTNRRAAAQTVRETLRTRPVQSDSAWNRLVREYAADTARASQMSRRYVPEPHLGKQLPALREALGALEEGDTAPVVTANGRYHVLRLDRRIPKGTAPKLRWIEHEIRRRLRIRARKQMYAHEVQRLRSNAQADGALETP